MTAIVPSASSSTRNASCKTLVDSIKQCDDKLLSNGSTRNAGMHPKEQSEHNRLMKEPSEHKRYNGGLKEPSEHKRSNSIMKETSHHRRSNGNMKEASEQKQCNRRNRERSEHKRSISRNDNCNEVVDMIKQYDDKLLSNVGASTHSKEQFDRRLSRSSHKDSTKSSTTKKKEKTITFEDDGAGNENDLHYSSDGSFLSDTNSRRGRRTAFDHDPKARNRSERRAIGNKLRQKNLVGNSFHSSSSHHSMNSSLQSSYYGSSQNSSSSSSCFDFEDDGSLSDNSRSSNDSKTKKTKKKRSSGSKQSKDCKALQFNASGDSLYYEEDSDCDSFCNDVDNIEMSIMELNKSLQFEDLTMDEKSKSKERSSFFRSSKNKRSGSLGFLDKSLSELKEKDLKKKGKNSSLHLDNETIDAFVADNVLSSSPEKETKKKRGTKSKRRTSTGVSNNKKNMKGCLKTSKRYFERKGTQRKDVRFDVASGSFEKVLMVKSYLKYAKDLWWTSNEIQQLLLNQSDFSSASASEIASVKVYVEAYCQGRHQMNYEHNISHDTLKELITGYIKGHCGIEAHSNLHDSIVQHIRDTNRSIIKAYQNAIVSEKALAAQGKRSKMDPAVTVKAHSEALTETDRKWAAAVGKAVRQSLD